MDAVAGEAGAAISTEGDRGRSAQESARGWHGVQLAVLGFIGLCGALGPDGGNSPRGLQLAAGALALIALAVACAATGMVATVAWPTLARSGGENRLRAGVRLTYVAVALMALSTTPGWWPSPAQDGNGSGAGVRVSTSGGALCGRLVPGAAGNLSLVVAGTTVTVPLSDVASVQPASGGCP